MALYLEVDHYYQMRRRVLQALMLCLVLVVVIISGLYLLLSPVHAAPADEFVTTWKTDNPGSSNSTQITIPTIGSGYDYNVDWDNDGVFDEFNLTGSVTHDFGTPGEYTIRIEGDFPRIYFNDDGDKEKIIRIDQWGTNNWTSMNHAFAGAQNLTSSASDTPNLSNVTDMSFMFNNASVFNQNISNWNTSNVTDMTALFFGASSFNGDISGWNTGNVTTMNSMFFGATSFNQDLPWNVSNVTNMENMFLEASQFNGNLSTWNTGSVITMSGMFSDASSFNQNISSWNTSNVTSMATMFNRAEVFNQDISTWSVSNVTDISSMFGGASAFNQNISSWDTSNVTNMNTVFYDAASFNQDISTWNTGNVTSMRAMFLYSAAFNQNLGTWDMHNVQNAVLMLSANGLSRINYESTLSGWSSQTLQSGVELGALGRTYCDKSGRQAIIDSYSWTFDGDSEFCYDIYLNNDTSGSVEEGMPIGTNIGTFTAVEDFIPNATSPFALSCTVAGVDDQYFAIDNNDANRLVTSSIFDHNAPTDADANNIYEICIRATDSNGNFSERNMSVIVTAAPLPPQKSITSVMFSEENGKKILDIDGIGFFETGDQEQALLRSLVRLNGQDLPFCADGTGYTAQELIDLFKQAYNVDITGNVSDNPPCYYYIRNGSPALTSTQVLVWLPDNFDTTAEGTVSVNGSNTYTFNAASPGNITPTAMVNGDKPINQTPNVSRRPVFSGVANPGATVLVSIDNGAVTCSAAADQSGNWSCTIPSVLALGAHTVSITVTELGGAVTVLGPYAFTVVDGNGPGTPIPGAPNTGFMQILQKYRTEKDNRQRMIVAVAIIISTITVLIGVRYTIKKRTTKVTFSS
jgi:surface protein